MTEFIPLVAPFNSFFSLSVALNFAYAASKSLREALKNGFINSVRHMSDSLKDIKKRIESTVMVMSDKELSESDKKNISQKLQEIADKIEEKFVYIEDDINTAQEHIANNSKPMYVYVGIFSIFMLFLSGQETIHKIFPESEIFFITLMSYFLVLLIWFVGFFKKTTFVSAPILASLEIIINSWLLFFPIEFIWLHGVNNKYIVDAAIILAFLPFMLTTLKLFYFQIKLELKYRFNYIRIRFDLYKVNRNKDQLKSSRVFFN